MFGTISIHTSSATKAYAVFIHDVADIELGCPILGIDEESVLVSNINAPLSVPFMFSYPVI